jgi:multidrug resistance efflux pump
MHDKGYLSEKEIDDLELKMRTASVELEQARLELSERTITAPFAGRVVGAAGPARRDRHRRQGAVPLSDFRSAARPRFFPERELARVRVGQPATLTLDAQPGRGARGRVSLVNPEVDRSNRHVQGHARGRESGGRAATRRVRRTSSSAPESSRTRCSCRAVGCCPEDGEDYVFVAPR